MKKLLLTTLAIFCIGMTTAHANPTEKQKIIDMVKSSDDNAKAYSSDGKRFYQKEYTLNDKGGVDMRVREKYLPAVTDGINRTPKTSYFAIAPKTFKYVGKASRLTNPIGIGLLMVDVLGSEDWDINPNDNTINYEPSGAYDYVCDGVVYAIEADALSCGYSKIRKMYNYQNGQELKYSTYWWGDNLFLEGHTTLYHRQLKKDKQVMTDEQFDAIVRDLAKAGNINAKQVILDAVKDEIADGKHDSEIIRLADDISQDTPTDDTPTEESPPDNPTDPSQGTGTDTDPKTDTPTNPNTGTGTAIGTEDTPKDNPDKTSSDLPPFCEWAKPVCDFIDWVRQESPQDEPPKTVPKAGVGDIPELSDVDRNKQYIDFTGECPTGQISFGINGTQYSYTMPYTHFCELLDKLSFWLLAFTYLSTAYFVVSNL